MDINIDESITKWEKDVIDTSKNNKILYFNPESFLKVATPSMLFLFDDLVNKDKTMSIHTVSDDENRKKDEIVFSKKEGISKILGNIFYQANNSLKEHGSNALFMSFGILKWTDENGKTIETQLFFVPVTLSRKMYDNFTLESKEGEIFFNPVLREKLDQYGIKFDFNFENNYNLTEAIRNLKLILNDTKWTVIKTSYLGIVSFTNNTIYNDIKRNHNAIKKNDLTRGLAGDFQVIKKLGDMMPKDIDYSINTVMDADSSQIQAIYSARQGASFILNGPPGTGKSQTIANIIADAMGNNKSVLFVSEKNAAIEVVKKRLDEVGLGDFILNFHGNVPKSDIIKSLYRSIENNKHSQGKMVPPDRYSETLNSYVHAIHMKRGNIGRSIYEACLLELDNANGIDVKISEKLLDLTPDELDSLEFKLTEFNDYIDIIGNYNSIPANINVEKYREDPENYYKSIEMIQDAILEIDELQELLQENELKLKTMKDLERLYTFVSIADPNTHLEEKYFDLSFIGEANRLLDLEANAIKELDHMMGIFLKKRKREFLDMDIDSIYKEMEGKYSSRWKRHSSAYKGLLREIMEKTPGKSRKSYEDIIDDLKLAIKIKEKQAELSSIQENIKTMNAGSSDVSDKIRYAGKIIAIYQDRDVAEKMVNLLEESSAKIDRVKFIYDSINGGINSIMEIFPSFGGMANATLDEVEDAVKNVSSFDMVRYSRFMEQCSELKDSGIDISSIFGSQIHGDSILHAFRYSFNHKFVEFYVRNDENLKNFRASSHERIIGMFIDYDKKRMEINRSNLVSELIEKRREAMGKYPGIQMIIKTENAKKRFQKPLKVLFSELKDAMPALKPCLMMSPDNVSAYLNNNFLFDLIIFDEASQLTPPEAVGSLIRARQAIISGDTQQLPPTTFFENINTSKYQDDYVVLDNILDQYDAIGLPKISLKWHYRSFDDSLIAFSNKYFYENSLETFPSAYKNSPDYGVQFVKIDGVYGRGKTRANKAEANEVVKIIKEELNRTTSIGIVTLSESQRSAVEETLNLYARNDEVLSKIINMDDIFVKNLENVQGDEKDVIILSTGYGRDENGKITMNFGPINSTGGEKRLNVAITRARKKFIVISSMDPEDIKTPENSGKGPELLKQYMIYARNPASEFYKEGFSNDDAIINDVASRLAAEGFRVEKNVGYSMNNIALAVIDPEDENQYILGIETDGKIYNRMKTASERERIRKNILSARGWHLYRIWSIDYMKNPEKVLHDIINSISRLKSNKMSEKSAGREI
jgi:DNA polymerase III delta prime subunit